MQKVTDNAKKAIYKNVEIRAGDIEKRISLDDNTVDVVISNCIIKLKSNKVNAFKENYRILKPNAIGKMIILGLVTGKEVGPNSINSYKWCIYIDGALTKESYIKNMKEDGFTSFDILDEKFIFRDGNATTTTTGEQ